MVDALDVDDWRRGRLVGTPEEIGEQLARWEEIGVDELVVSAGPLPFSLGLDDDLEILAAALVGSGSERMVRPAGSAAPLR
jgi:alkanesulfonate monooxygenase SsuD/methylene tetrahydromethanopterin reductase-like flavin-dependent oxidoreductase (luciferase family)